MIRLKKLATSLAMPAACISMIYMFLTLVLLTSSYTLHAQVPGVHLEYIEHETDGIPIPILQQRRKRILQNHSNKSLIVLFSADIRNRQNDVDYEYRQNSNLLYVSGCTESNTALLLIPGGTVIDGQTVTELFFVRPRDPSREIWRGVNIGLVEAQTQLGFQKAVNISRLSSIIDSLLFQRDTLFIASGMPTASLTDPLSGVKLSADQKCKDFVHASHPDVYVRTSLQDMAQMREIKDEEELRLLRKAIDISVDAHLATIRGAQPTMREYELEALMEYGFKKGGAEDVGYPSIVGSGYNSCFLHYDKNRKTTKQGDLVLADCGAEYHGYTADITRTFPIDGQFNKEQRIIYDAVLEAQDSGIAACRAGNAFRASHKAAFSVVQRRLFELGIIQDSAQARYYFMHGTSHYLGLDVHDAGTMGVLKPGVVMTVEPGIYIPEGSPCDKKWWNTGVRIEDDILVTSNEPVNLSGRLPRRADDIEALMRKAK